MGQGWVMKRSLLDLLPQANRWSSRERGPIQAEADLKKRVGGDTMLSEARKPRVFPLQVLSGRVSPGALLSLDPFFHSLG